MRDLWFLLSRANKLYTRHLDTELQKVFLTTNQYYILKKLELEALGAPELAIHFGSERSTVTRALQILYRRKLIVPAGHKRRRAVAFELTEAARVLLYSASRILRLDRFCVIAEPLSGALTELQDFVRSTT